MVDRPRAKLWFDFCARYGLGAEPVPLFSSAEGVVQTVPLGRNQQPVLARSLQMEKLLLAETTKLIADHVNDGRRYEGLIYCMFEIEEGRPLPLYIGKAEKLGRDGAVLSANLNGIRAGTGHPFARWGYNYAYHLGDLSSAVLGHRGVSAAPKYLRWAESLFTNPFSGRTLVRPVFFWCMAWEANSVGPWLEYGATSLTFLEYLLIGIASAEFPRLLNEEGVNRV